MVQLKQLLLCKQFPLKEKEEQPQRYVLFQTDTNKIDTPLRTV